MSGNPNLSAVVKVSNLNYKKLEDGETVGGHTFDENAIYMIQDESITYTNVSGTGYRYFLKIDPDDFTCIWHIKYSMNIFIPGHAESKGTYIVEFNGVGSTCVTYACWNSISSTNYLPIYYHGYNLVKSADKLSTYSHYMGIHMNSAWNPSSSGYGRTIECSILEFENCTPSFLQAVTPYSNISGMNTTNYAYDGGTTLNAQSQGLQETGDSTDDGNYLDTEYYFRPYIGETVYRYKVCALDKDNRIVPLTITNQTNTTQVVKHCTTSAFKPGIFFHYSGTDTYSAGSAGPTTGYWYTRYYTTDAVYNFNHNFPASHFVYLKGTYDHTTGLFTLYHDAANTDYQDWYKFVPANTANLNLAAYFDEGYYYILLGSSYSTENYWGLMDFHPMYYFDGANLVDGYTANINASITWGTW